MTLQGWKPLAAVMTLMLSACSQADPIAIKALAPKPITFVGTTHFGSTTITRGDGTKQAFANVAPAPSNGLSIDSIVHLMPRHTLSPHFAPSARSRAVTAPVLGQAASTVVKGTSSLLNGFSGISNRDQVYSGTGIYQHTNYTLEPPDQALAVGNGFVVEAVNNAVAIYKTTGGQVGPTVPVNQFFHQAPELDFTNVLYGTSFSDPRAFYDSVSKRFFIEEWAQAVDPVTGNGLADSIIFLAVSKTSDPTGDYFIYAINTTYDSLSPNDPQIPDYTSIGVDANGVYLSSNMFSLTQDVNPHVNFYVIPKADLIAGNLPNYVEIDGVGQSLDTPDTLSFSITPVTVPPHAPYEAKMGGTEFFVSTPFEGSGVGSVVEVWALTNTSSLLTATPSLKLAEKTVTTETYALAPFSQQKDGPRPLGLSLKEPVPVLESIGTRIMPPMFSNGVIYASLDTAVLGPRQEQAGAAYFVLAPYFNGTGQLLVNLAAQGYVGVPGEDILFPTIGLNATRDAFMTFTLAGADNYPSAAYVSFHDGIHTVRVSGAGAGPADGFTGYSIGGGPPERWGDYSAAAVDDDGTIWLAQEYIPSTTLKPRLKFANWGTFISHVSP